MVVTHNNLQIAKLITPPIQRCTDLALKTQIATITLLMSTVVLFFISAATYWLIKL